MKQQKGMALLIVLFMLAIMSIIAVSINERWQRSLQRTTTLKQQMEAKWYILSAEELVKKRLLEDIKASTDKISLSQFWAKQGRVFNIGDATAELVVVDEQACFNINSINQNKGTDDDEETIYPAKILKELLIKLDVAEYEASLIVDAIADWVDSDDIVSTYGAEDSYYMTRKVPYRAANRLMYDISELRAIKGIDAVLYQKLRPYVCALPTTELQININTIRSFQSYLLSAIFMNQLGDEDINDIIKQRPADGWDDTEELLTLKEVQQTQLNTSVLARYLDITSQYFRMIVQITTEDFQYQASSLLQINHGQVVVIQRQYSNNQLKAKSHG